MQGIGHLTTTRYASSTGLGREMPVHGQGLTSRVAVGLEHLAVGDTHNGFSAIRHIFRGLDDLIEKSDITIYTTLLLVVADAYRDVQGCDTFDNIERRIEAIKAGRGTPDTAKVEKIIADLDNMQILAATHEGPFQSPNIIEYELWKIELLQSIEPGSDFVNRCNGLLNRIVSTAIDKEWRLWGSWLLWVSGEVMYELGRFFDNAGDDEG
ncbi:hypothetical protein SGCOL_009389 [Colletotrichum sp. CLE4]